MSQIIILEVALFHRPGKRAKPAHAKPLKELTAIELPEQLLTGNKREDLLQKIKHASALDETRFNQLATTLLKSFANHCQSLPHSANTYYTQPGGILDHALNRTEAALSLFRDFVILEGQSLSEEQKLWQYVLFSASILQGVGKLQIDFQVNLYDKNGHGLKVWNPLLENMAAYGSYYQYDYQDESDELLRRRLNLLLARLIMPSGGFAWIAANAEALAVWLALLNEDWEAAGTLGALLVRANAISVQRYLNELLLKQGSGRGGRLNRINTFIDSTPDAASDREHLTAIQFIEWMINALEKGTIMVNKAPLYMVPGGMLMCADMFKLFIREHPEFKNWQAVQNAFLSLGLHQANPEGGAISRFEQLKTQQMVSGVILSDFAIALPEKIQVHNMNNGKSSTLSAIELVHLAQSHQQFVQTQQAPPNTALQQLSAKGLWHTINPSQQASHKPGVKVRG